MSVCLDEVPDVVDSGLLYSRKHRELLVSCGDVVTAASSSREVLGVVRHIGGVTKAEPCVKFLGLELMEPKGDCDGAVFEGGETTRYFRTDPKHALFVDVRRGVAKIASDRLLQSLFQTTATLKKRTAEVQHLARERKLLCAKAADLQSANAAMRAKLLEASHFISNLRTNVVVLQKQLLAYRSVGSPVECQCPLSPTFSAPRQKSAEQPYMVSTPLKLAKAQSVPRPHFGGSFAMKVESRRTASTGIGSAKLQSLCTSPPVSVGALSSDPLFMAAPMRGRVPAFQPLLSLSTSGSSSYAAFAGFREPTQMELAMVSPRIGTLSHSTSAPPPMFVAPRGFGLDKLMHAKLKMTPEDSDQSEEGSSYYYSEDDSKEAEGSGDDTESEFSESYGASDAKLRALIDAKLQEKLYGKRRSDVSSVKEDGALHILEVYDDDSIASDADEEDMDLLLSDATHTLQTPATSVSYGMSLTPIVESPQIQSAFEFASELQKATEKYDSAAK